MRFLAVNTDDIFGKIKPPPGLEEFKDTRASLSNVLTVALQLFIIIAGLTTFLNLLRGSFDWLTSGGEKEKLQAAQQRLGNAVLGLGILFGVLTIIFVLEKFVFQGNFCFGLTCGIRIPQLGN